MGLLHLTVSPVVYTTLLATTFIAPVKPGAKPTIPSIALGPHITNLRYAHDVATAVFNEYDRTNKELCQMIIAAVNEIFIRSLRHRYVGYCTTTTRKILDHLYATYTNISSPDLQDNDAKLRGPYDSNLPIEAIIDQVEGAVKYATAGNTPYNPLKFVGIAYQLIFQTEMFNDNCKQWKRRDPSDKTWTEFKIFPPHTRNCACFKPPLRVLATTPPIMLTAKLPTRYINRKLSTPLKACPPPPRAIARRWQRSTPKNSTLAAALTLSNNKLVTALQDVARLTGTISELRRKTGYQSTATEPEVGWSKRH